MKVEDVSYLFNRIRDAGLSAPAEMLGADAESIEKACNGLGCSEMPGWARRALDKIMPFALASGAVHDWRYTLSDGTEKGREAADKEFRSNMLDEIEYEGGLFKILKQRLALAAYSAVKNYGRGAWCVAYAERTAEKKEEDKKEDGNG